MALSKKTTCGKLLRREKTSGASRRTSSRSTKGRVRARRTPSLTKPPNPGDGLSSNAAIRFELESPNRVIHLVGTVSRVSLPWRLCTFRNLNKRNERHQGSSATRDLDRFVVIRRKARMGLRF